MRVSLSTSYWPLAWPPPEPVTLEIFAGVSTVTIPERPPQEIDGQLPVFGEAEGARPVPQKQIEPAHHNWFVKRDLAVDRSTLEVINDSGTFYLPHADVTVRSNTVERYCSVADEFDTARGEAHWEREFSRGDWNVRTVTRTVLTSTPTDFHIMASLDAYEGEKRVFSRNWDVTVPRDLI